MQPSDLPSVHSPSKNMKLIAEMNGEDVTASIVPEPAADNYNHNISSA